MDPASIPLEYGEDTELSNLDWKIVEALCETDHISNEDAFSYPLDSDNRQSEYHDTGYHPLSVEQKQPDMKTNPRRYRRRYEPTTLYKYISQSERIPTAKPYEYSGMAYNSTVPLPGLEPTAKPYEYSGMAYNSTVPLPGLEPTAMPYQYSGMAYNSTVPLPGLEPTAMPYQYSGMAYNSTVPLPGLEPTAMPYQYSGMAYNSTVPLPELEPTATPNEYSGMAYNSTVPLPELKPTTMPYEYNGTAYGRYGPTKPSTYIFQSERIPTTKPYEDNGTAYNSTVPLPKLEPTTMPHEYSGTAYGRYEPTKPSKYIFQSERIPTTKPYEYSGRAYNSTVPLPKLEPTTMPHEYNGMAYNSTVPLPDYTPTTLRDPTPYDLPICNNMTYNSSPWSQNQVQNSETMIYIPQTNSDISRFAEPYVYDPRTYNSIQLKPENNWLSVGESTTLNSSLWTERTKLSHPKWLAGNCKDKGSNTLTATMPKMLFDPPGLKNRPTPLYYLSLLTDPCSTLESEVLPENLASPMPTLDEKSQSPAPVDSMEPNIRNKSYAPIYEMITPPPTPPSEVPHPVKSLGTSSWNTNLVWSLSNAISALSTTSMDPAIRSIDIQSAGEMQAAPSIMPNGLTGTVLPSYPYSYDNYPQ